MKDSIIQSGGWFSRQRHGRPRSRRACRIAAYVLGAAVVAVFWLLRLVAGTPTMQEAPFLVRGGDILAWTVILIDLALWVRAGILGLRESPGEFEEMTRNRHPDPRKLY